MCAYRLTPGHTWNPLLGAPRNSLCPCGSQKKFKKCHGPSLERTCTTDAAQRLEPVVDLLKKEKRIAVNLEDSET